MVKANPRMGDFIEKEKKHFEEKIKQLSDIPIPPKIDGQEFDDIIFKLVEGKIRQFHFFINLEKHIYLDFKKNANFIIITIPKIKKLKKNYILHKSKMK